MCVPFVWPAARSEELVSIGWVIMRRGFTRRPDTGKLTRVQSRSLWFTGPRTVELRSGELAPLEPNQVLVSTLYSGISGGTEMLAYRGQLDAEMPLDDTIGALGGTFRYPFRYGYSCVGTVVESRSAIGAGATVFAFHPHQDVFVADAADVVPVGGHDGVDPRVATLFPLVETALQITLDSGPVAFERVAVFGLGTVGILTALLLQRAGAHVLGVDPADGRRDVAGQLGLDACAPSDVGDTLGDRRLALAIEASGSPAALTGTLPCMDHEGTVLVASWYGTTPVELPLGADFHRRRLTLRSTQVSSIPAAQSARWDIARRRDIARRLLGELPLAVLATHTFDFERADDAFAAIDSAADGLIHAALGYS